MSPPPRVVDKPPAPKPLTVNDITDHLKVTQLDSKLFVLDAEDDAASVSSSAPRRPLPSTNMFSQAQQRSNVGTTASSDNSDTLPAKDRRKNEG